MIRFLALGSPELRDSRSQEIRGVLTQPRLLALLVYLCLARPRAFHRRDSLVATFWPELPHDAARNALRQAVHRLRRRLGDDVVASRGADEIGVDAALLSCDVVDFGDSIDSEHLEEALALYRGDLLPGFFVSDAPEFERWLDEERQRLRQSAAGAASHLSARKSADGQSDSAIHWARFVLALRPDDEIALRRLIELQLRAGDRAGAMRAHEAFARRLADELDMTPSAETEALVRRVRESSAGLAVRTGLPEPLDPTLMHDSSAPAAPVDSGPASKPRSWYRRSRVGIGVVIGLAVVLVASRLPRALATSDPGARERIAVFPFAIRGGGELAFLREGLVDLLSAKLDGATGLHAIDPRSVLASLPRGDADDPVKATTASARRLGAGWMIVGDVVEIAGRLHVNASLYDVSGRTRQVATHAVSGETTALFELVDDLAGQLLATIAPGRDTLLTRVAALTTHSLPALKAFLEGERAFRGGHDARATDLFHDAVTLDSTFALANYRLAVSATWAGSRATVTNPTVWAEAAARHGTRLTPLARDLLAAYRRYRVLDPGAEATYLSITRSHPDNVEAWLMLGETYFHLNPMYGRSIQESEAAFRRAAALDRRNYHALIHLARLATLNRNVRELDSLAREFVAQHHGGDRIAEIRTLQAFVRDDTLGHAAAMRQASNVTDTQLLGMLLGATAFAESPHAARAFAPRFMRVPDGFIRQPMSHLLSEHALVRGRWDRRETRALLGSHGAYDWLLQSEALLASEPSIALPRARVAAIRDSIWLRRDYPSILRTGSAGTVPFGAAMRAYLLGLLDTRLGDTASGRRWLRTLESMQGGDMRIATNLGHGLRAELARTNGDLPAALAELDRFVSAPAMPTIPAGWGLRERFLQAELLAASGRLREAITVFGSQSETYLTFVAPAHLRQAELYEQLGERDRARFHFERFVKLYDGCDAELRHLLDRGQAGLRRVGR